MSLSLSVFSPFSLLLYSGVAQKVQLSGISGNSSTTFARDYRLLFFSIPPWPHPYLIRWVHYPQLFFFSTPLSMTTTNSIRIWYDESESVTRALHRLHSCCSRLLSLSSSGFDTMSVTIHSYRCISLICMRYDGICLFLRPSKILLESSCNSIWPLSYLPPQGSSSSKTLILRVRLHLYHMCKREGLYTTILYKMPELLITTIYWPKKKRKQGRLHGVNLTDLRQSHTFGSCIL